MAVPKQMHRAVRSRSRCQQQQDHRRTKLLTGILPLRRFVLGSAFLTTSYGKKSRDTVLCGMTKLSLGRSYR